MRSSRSLPDTGWHVTGCSKSSGRTWTGTPPPPTCAKRLTMRARRSERPRRSSCEPAPSSCSRTVGVRTDLELFLAAAEEALSAGDPAACARVVATCHDELLPDAPYESWTQEPRRRVQARLAELVRASGDVERLLEVEPTDEAACRAVMSAAIEAGRRHAAIRAYERLRLALARELGAAPGAQTRALYARCTSGVRLGETSFVGRELELAAATAELRRVEGGGTAAIAVRGTIGMGKSAFCRELLHRAAGEGWRVLTVAATTSGVPYAPLSAMLEQVLTGSHGAVAGLRGRTRSVLGELTPLVKAGAPLSGPMTRHQVIAAVRRSLTLTDPAPPTLVCLEDAHLADEASADVLRQLVAAGAGCPFALVVAVRSEWVRTSLPRGIDELVRSAQTQLLRLPPMEIEELERLVAVCAPQSAPAAAAEIARRAEGSPFFALELGRAMGGEPLPRTVREAITERFLALDAGRSISSRDSPSPIASSTWPACWR